MSSALWEMDLSFVDNQDTTGETGRPILTDGELFWKVASAVLQNVVKMYKSINQPVDLVVSVSPMPSHKCHTC